MRKWGRDMILLYLQSFGTSRRHDPTCIQFWDSTFVGLIRILILQSTRPDHDRTDTEGRIISEGSTVGCRIGGVVCDRIVKIRVLD